MSATRGRTYLKNLTQLSTLQRGSLGLKETSARAERCTIRMGLLLFISPLIHRTSFLQSSTSSVAHKPRRRRASCLLKPTFSIHSPACSPSHDPGSARHCLRVTWLVRCDRVHCRVCLHRNMDEGAMDPSQRIIPAEGGWRSSEGCLKMANHLPLERYVPPRTR